MLVALLVALLYLYRKTGHVAGLLVWSHEWSPCYMVLLFAWSTYQSLCISVHADEDLEKYVLETSKLCCTMFKCKCPADTEDEALVGISSEDGAEDLDLDPAIAHQAVRQGAPAPIVGTSAVPSAEVRSAATVVCPTPGPEEVIIKKAALVTMQKQMAALVRGEDLPASQPGAREVQDVPYVVLVVGREDTKCPICHLVFKTPY